MSRPAPKNFLEMQRQSIACENTSYDNADRSPARSDPRRHTIRLGQLKLDQRGSS
jgi:hypothetical protein